jgi:hypothetical protein
MKVLVSGPLSFESLPSICEGPYRNRGIPGIEPGTSRTRSEHNATIPNPRDTILQCVADILYRVAGRETFFLSFSSFSLPNTAAIAVTALLLLLQKNFHGSKETITSELNQVVARERTHFHPMWGSNPRPQD